MSDFLDQRGDTNWSGLQQYLQLYPFPSYVLKDDKGQSRKLAEFCEPPGETVRYFADARMPHQFPIHTKAALAVSYVYWMNNEDRINQKIRPFIEERFQKAAEHFNAKADLKQLREKHAALNVDPELPDSTYALVSFSENGAKERRYPLRNPMEVKAAADWYVTNEAAIRDAYPVADRQRIAEKILEKAAHFGAAIGSHLAVLEKMSGRGVGSPTKIASAIRDRTRAGHRVEPEVRARLEKLAEAIASKPQSYLDPGTAKELVAVIDVFDRSHGLLNKYSELIPSPEDLVYEIAHSKLSEIRDTACQLVTGATFDSREFSKLAADDLRDLFGDEITAAVSSGLRLNIAKVAEFAATLPRGDAQMFEALLEEKGVRPLAKEASEYRIGFSPDELAAMAAAG